MTFHAKYPLIRESISTSLYYTSVHILLLYSFACRKKILKKPILANTSYLKISSRSLIILTNKNTKIINSSIHFFPNIHITFSVMAVE